jgi:exonuclease III
MGVEHTPLLLLGDFNAIRRADYDGATWDALVRWRDDVGITTETEVTDELERAVALGGWGLTDCRAAAGHVHGPTPTSIHGARVDYTWLSAAGAQQWEVVSHAHVLLEPEDVTDHLMVVCKLRPRSDRPTR